MAKIDFQNFTIPVGISKKRKQTGDARETIANLVYTRSMGIKAHHLAFKIYESNGATEFSDDEVNLIKELVEHYCFPSIIDSLNEQLNCQTDKNE